MSRCLSLRAIQSGCPDGRAGQPTHRTRRRRGSPASGRQPGRLCRRRVARRRMSRCTARAPAGRTTRCRRTRSDGATSGRRRRATRAVRAGSAPPPARIAKTTVTSGQRSWRAGEPGEVRPLHLARVVDDGRPPGGCRRGWAAGDRVDEEEARVPAARRGSARDPPGRPAGRRRSTPRQSLSRGRPAASGTIRPGASAASSTIPSSQIRTSGSRSDGSSAVEPERRLQRDDRGVDLVQVEQGEPGRQVVIAEVDGRCAFGHVQDVAVEIRSARCAATSASLNGRRPEMLVDVEARHRQAQILPESGSPRRVARGPGARRPLRGTERSAERCRAAGWCRPRAGRLGDRRPGPRASARSRRRALRARPSPRAVSPPAAPSSSGPRSPRPGSSRRGRTRRAARAAAPRPRSPGSRCRTR